MALATSEGKLDINLQLDAKMSRVTKVSAKVDTAASVICAQNVRLQAFKGEHPAAALLAGVTEDQLQNAATFMGSRTVQEILKTYGPNEDTMLIVFCGKKICAQNRADIFQVDIRNYYIYDQFQFHISIRWESPVFLNDFSSFQLTRRILCSSDPNVRRNIIQKNAVGISALEKAAMHNKPHVAAFLAEVLISQLSIR